MQYNRYTKTLQKKIKKLNLDYEDNCELLICIYLYGGCSEEDCARLFNFTLDSVINYLKYEQIHDYRICSECEKLKRRIEFKTGSKDRKNINYCIECKKIKKMNYYLNNKEIKLEYMNNYYKKNKEDRLDYMKDYYLNNKEKRNFYLEENKDKIK